MNPRFPPRNTPEYYRYIEELWLKIRVDNDRQWAKIREVESLLTGLDPILSIVNLGFGQDLGSGSGRGSGSGSGSGSGTGSGSGSGSGSFSGSFCCFTFSIDAGVACPFLSGTITIRTNSGTPPGWVLAPATAFPPDPTRWWLYASDPFHFVRYELFDANICDGSAKTFNLQFTFGCPDAPLTLELTPAACP
jgi:hypothetical protein